MGKRQDLTPLSAFPDGVLDPERCIQIGIRGGAEYLWEFSHEAGMTVPYAEDVMRISTDAVIARALEVVGSGPVYVTFDVDGIDPGSRLVPARPRSVA